MVTFDLGRVTTNQILLKSDALDCGDVRSRTSYNTMSKIKDCKLEIVVTFDLGRVTTDKVFTVTICSHCGDVRSRTSYNLP